MTGGWYNCIFAPLHHDNLADKWAAGDDKQECLMKREGAAEEHCKFSLEDLDAEYAHEHGKGAHLGIPRAGSETKQTCF